MFNFKARILLKERDKFAGCVFWREHLESGLWTPCNKVNFLWPVSILSTQILIPFASKSIRNNEFHYMKESPHCPCIPGVWREMRQLFGFNSLKNLAFHIAAESVLSSLVQTAEGEKSRQGKRKYILFCSQIFPFVRGLAGPEHPHPSQLQGWATQLQFCVSQVQNLAFVQQEEVLWFNKDPDVVWVGENGARKRYFC